MAQFFWQPWTQAANYWITNGGNVDEAQKFADKATTFGPPHFALLRVRAAIAEKKGDAKKAEALRAEALKIAEEPELNNYGYALIQQKKLDEAIVIFARNVKDHPGVVEHLRQPRRGARAQGRQGVGEGELREGAVDGEGRRQQEAHHHHPHEPQVILYISERSPSGRWAMPGPSATTRRAPSAATRVTAQFSIATVSAIVAAGVGADECPHRCSVVATGPAEVTSSVRSACARRCASASPMREANMAKLGSDGATTSPSAHATIARCEERADLVVRVVEAALGDGARHRIGVDVAGQPHGEDGAERDLVRAGQLDGVGQLGAGGARGLDEVARGVAVAAARPAEDGVEADGRAREVRAEVRRLAGAERRQDVVVVGARRGLAVADDEDLGGRHQREARLFSSMSSIL